MEIINTILIASALAMDAFTVSVSTGSLSGRHTMKEALLIAGYFGFFQFAMPLAGWTGGFFFKNLINSFDHWIAFGLMLAIGGKMLWETKKVEEETREYVLKHVSLLFLAIATSIDALGIGLSYAFLDKDILSPSIIIGIITFILSFVGYNLGRILKSIVKNKAEIFGGIVLIAIGFKILSDHGVFD